MNYLVQRGKVRSQVINVPEGLPEILADITREVLRCQPATECLCQFIMDYLHQVMVTRDKALITREIIERALKMVEEVIADICMCSMEQWKANEMALAMEDCFRRFLEQRRCEERTGKEIVKFHEQDMIDELIRRCKFTEDELKITQPMIDEAYNRFVRAYMLASDGTNGTEALYVYFRDREKKRKDEIQENIAALRIQKNFRGYMVRKIYSNVGLHKGATKDEAASARGSKEESIDIDLEDPELAVAAVKIQKFFRSHQPDERKETLKIASKSVLISEAQPEQSVKAESIDVDLDDPELAVAAVKIQKFFRKHQSVVSAKERATEAVIAEHPAEVPAEAQTEPPAEAPIPAAGPEEAPVSPDPAAEPEAPPAAAPETPNEPPPAAEPAAVPADAPAETPAPAEEPAAEAPAAVEEPPAE